MGKNYPMSNSNEITKCNQKQGVYCDGFKLMMGAEQCVYVEHMGEMFPEAKIKFKGNRLLLRHCPECGGDLRFR